MFSYSDEARPVNGQVDADQFLASCGIADYRIEPLSGKRRRILVEHRGRTLAVSFAARVPHRRTSVVSKLRQALREMEAA
jgi:hypothetical protein